MVGAVDDGSLPGCLNLEVTVNYYTILYALNICVVLGRQ